LVRPSAAASAAVVVLALAAGSFSVRTPEAKLIVSTTRPVEFLQERSRGFQPVGSTVPLPSSTIPGSTVPKTPNPEVSNAARPSRVVAVSSVTTTAPAPLPAGSTVPPETTTTTTEVLNVPALEREFVGKVNGLRSAVGVSKLVADGALTTIARNWSERMVATGNFAHNPNLAGQVPGGWSQLAENLVRGAATVAEAYEALKASAGHYENMVDPAFTHIGIGIAIDADGKIWATQVFAVYDDA
jgi:uncharacterized protein YkwD